jgi:DNA-binding CsgD family transcriptional regulator
VVTSDRSAEYGRVASRRICYGEDFSMMPGLGVPRTDHEDLLIELLAESCAGKGRVALISAAPTLGKTWLINRVVEQATKAGALVLTATASAAERLLPLGVIRQLLRGLRASSPGPEPVGAPTGPSEHPDWETLDARAVEAVCSVFLQAAGQQPVVICVDDLNEADQPSLDVVRALARRLHGARLLMVLTDTPQAAVGYPSYHVELLRSPHVHPIGLEPLSLSETAQGLRDGHQDATAQLTREYHALSGGNPLLLQALLDDVDGRALLPVPGDSFARAVLFCLYRCEPGVLRVAQALAALDRPVSPELVAGALGMDAGFAQRAIQQLTQMGLANGDGLRHPATAATILGSLGEDERAQLHLRTAIALYGHDATATELAPHLLAGGPACPGWAAAVLRDAADDFLLTGDEEQAVRCLTAVRKLPCDAHERATATAMLAHIGWHTDPARVLPYLTPISAAAAAGDLDARYEVAVANFLAWHGRTDQAVALLDRLSAVADLDVETARATATTLVLLGYCYPDHGTFVRDRLNVLTSRHRLPPPASPLMSPADVLAAVAAYSPYADAVAAAEPMLRQACQNEALGPLAVAATALIFADRLGATVAWRDPFESGEATGRSATSRALRSAVEAEEALDRGDLRAVDRHVRHALRCISAKGWGLLLGNLLATAILAAAARGDESGAREYLRMPLPAALFRTPFGVRYLHARGKYFLITGRIEAAVRDSQTCGDMLACWGRPMSALVAWRTIQAHAQLLLGRPRKSQELAREQLRHIGEGQHRVRAITLRVLAAASDPVKRVPALEEAVQLLHTSGDQAQLRRAYLDLSNAFYELGDSTKARATLRRTQLLRADIAPPEPVPDQQTVAGAATTGEQEGTASLSEAELRVADLAVSGDTNREIASKLFITVSTVEQHLTRVYRKLHVRRRADLPAAMESRVFGALALRESTRTHTEGPETTVRTRSA